MLPCIHASTSTHLLRAASTLELYASMYPCLYVYTPAACLQHFILPYLHVYTPAPRRQRSRALCFHPLRLHSCNAPPVLHTSASAHVQHDSRALYLLLCVVMLAARAYRSPSLHTSMPPRRYNLQGTPRPPNHKTSIPPHLHTCIAIPVLHIPTPAAHLQTSIPPYFHACTTAQL